MILTCGTRTHTHTHTWMHMNRPIGIYINICTLNDSFRHSCSALDWGQYGNCFWQSAQCTWRLSHWTRDKGHGTWDMKGVVFALFSPSFTFMGCKTKTRTGEAVAAHCCPWPGNVKTTIKIVLKWKKMRTIATTFRQFYVYVYIYTYINIVFGMHVCVYWNNAILLLLPLLLGSVQAAIKICPAVNEMDTNCDSDNRRVPARNPAHTDTHRHTPTWYENNNRKYQYKKVIAVSHWVEVSFGAVANPLEMDKEHIVFGQMYVTHRRLHLRCDKVDILLIRTKSWVDLPMRIGKVLELGAYYFLDTCPKELWACMPHHKDQTLKWLRASASQSLPARALLFVFFHLAWLCVAFISCSLLFLFVIFLRWHCFSILYLCGKWSVNFFNIIVFWVQSWSGRIMWVNWSDMQHRLQLCLINKSPAIAWKRRRRRAIAKARIRTRARAREGKVVPVNFDTILRYVTLASFLRAWNCVR